MSKSTKNKKQNIANEKNKKESTNKKHILTEEVKSKTKDDKDKKSKERSASMPDIVESTSVKEDTISNIASITTEVIKQTVLSATLGDPSSKYKIFLLFSNLGKEVMHFNNIVIFLKFEFYIIKQLFDFML